MYLSQIELNVRLSATKRAVASPQVLHGAVQGSFPSAQKTRTLWRLDRIANQFFLLVLSEGKPDFRHIVEQYGWPAAEQQWQTKDYLPFLSSLAVGQKWQFRLRANPTHAAAAKEGERGKIFAHVTVAQQEQWLVKKAEKCGFELDGFCVVQRDLARFSRHQIDGRSAVRSGQVVTLGVATFEGILTVSDADLLREYMTKGIGRAKAYGCGLLTLTRP